MISEDERRELESLREWYKNSRRSREKYESASSRGLLALGVTWILSYVFPKIFASRLGMAIVMVGMSAAFLSPYIGPFKKKEE